MFLLSGQRYSSLAAEAGDFDGALKALREAGLTVPGDIAIAAFDAFDGTGLITPLITSVNQPAQQIGDRAAQILLARIESGAAGGERVILEPSFIDGDSW